MKYSIPKDELIVLVEFLTESRDHLEGIEDKVLKLEVSKDVDLINSIFRPIHTIKGTSSFLGLDDIGDLSHELETLLDNIRKGRITEIESDIIDVILEAIDTVSKMLKNTNAAVDGVEPTGETVETDIEAVDYRDILARVIRFQDGTPPAAEPPRTGPPPVESLTPPPETYDEPDYPHLNFPGEMKLQYEVEGMDKVGVVEKTLLALEKDPRQTVLINDLFRALHTLKGNTGVILSTIDDETIRTTHYLNQFRDLAHAAESIVQKKRDFKQPLLENEIEVLLAAADCLKHILDCFKQDRRPVKDACPIMAQLVRLSEGAVGVTGVTGASNIKNTGGVTDTGNIKDIGGDSLAEAVSNSLEQAIETIATGLDEVGDDARRGRALKKLKRSYKNLAKIGQKINHPLLLSCSSNGLNLVDFMLKGKDGNEDLVVNSLREDLEALREKGDRRKAEARPDRRKATLPPPTTDKDLEVRISDKILKVSQEKIDVFMNLIGELLVSKNSLSAFEKEVSLKYDLPEVARRLKEVSDTIARISNDLQSNIMEIRMLPVASAFSKFPRMIRDLSKKLKKKMRLEISGEETEVDKNIIEALTDPLVHMIRNSADHGIEPPAERAAAGKPEEGVISLSAFNQGQYVMIRIADDGRGIDPQRIKQKAMEKGLVPPEELERMDDPQIFSLIFLPGFSMAGEVSDVSGRGVGMDVVRDNVERLGGDVQIDSTLGSGSTFIIKLPLTMAIGRGLEVEAHQNRYYIPLEAIIETLRIDSESIFRYKGREMTVIRDELIPVYRLGVQLGLEKTNGNFQGNDNEAMVMLNIKNQKTGLLVDNYFNETEYVIKPLTGALSGVEGISGAMITGEGRVHLILDLMRLF